MKFLPVSPKQNKPIVSLYSHFPNLSFHLSDVTNLEDNYQNICENLIIHIKKYKIERAIKWCKKNNPSLSIYYKNLNIEKVFTYKNGIKGEQLFLFTFDF
jgi:hypothetical protein